MQADSKTAGHTAPTNPAKKAARSIAASVNEQLTSAGLTKGSGPQFVNDCATDFWPIIREAYAPLVNSHEALREALRDAQLAIRELLKAHGQLMPGLAAISVNDYANINEAPIRGAIALKAAEKALALAEEQ